MPPIRAFDIHLTITLPLGFDMRSRDNQLDAARVQRGRDLLADKKVDYAAASPIATGTDVLLADTG